MTLQELVLENVDFTEYYKLEFEGWDGNHNTNVICPFHDEKKASFSVNINGTGGCVCHGCGTKIGSIIHFEKLKYKLPDDESAASSIYSKGFRPVLASPGKSEQHLSSYKIALEGTPPTKKKILEDIQITEQTIQRFQLGWDSGLRRVSIPIFDSFNQLLNIRLYRLPSMREDEKFPKLLNTEGYGSPAELFPKQHLFSLCRGKHRPSIVYWFTGERDTLLAWDRGIPSFCYTSGENVCKQEWGEELKTLGISVGIVSDNDKAGQDGANKRKSMLQSQGVSCFIVQFKNDGIKDFSDFIKEGNTVKDFLKLGHFKNGTKPTPTEEKEIPIPEGESIRIGKIQDPSQNAHKGEYTVADIGRNPELLNYPVQVKAIVSGKMDRTYSIPQVIKIGEQLYNIPISREMLLLVRENDDQINKLIHKWLTTKAPIKVIKHITVTEVEIIPMIQPGIDTLYVNQRCYYFGDYLECNKPYMMQLIPTTDMRTQETIAMITEIKPISNILDKYTFDEKSCEVLRNEFSIGDANSFDCLKKLAHSISINWSHIFNRDDLHICALLTWLSPLQFEFPCEGIQRGWLNTLVLGDTETGKSLVCKHITNLFHCGVFINAESCSYVGLVGGAVKSSSGMFILRWGKIPLYNRQLVVVEELSGLSVEEISYMSEIRSAGIARYDKAGLTGETSAKTRLICLSNVRGRGKSLGDYNTGVQAAQELVGQNEDLARFDLILTATDDEVDGRIINQDQTTKEKESFSSVELTAFKELAMFAWSLKPDQIDFTTSAYRACLQQTLKMAGEYHSSLPVFKSGSGRLKLARIALSIACIQFSWDSERGKLLVTDKHVEAAAKLLNHLFQKPSFGYARYSKIQYGLERVLDEDKVIQRMQEVFKDKEEQFCRYIANCLSFTKFELSEALGVHFMFAERMISQMFLSNLLKKGDQRGEWILSRAGRKWFEKISAQYSKI